jgi:hypothetical protein
MVALERQLSESGVIAARILKTRFLSVTFPISIMEEAYPEDVPGVNAPSSFSGDSDYQESEWSDIHCWSDDSLSDPEGAYELDDGPAASEVGELIGEIADIEIDRNQDAWAPHVVHRLEDLDDYGTPSVRRLQFQIYGATRRLLEACSDTLEVLSLYYTRGSAFQLEVLVPPLPRLRHLSVGSVKAYLEIHIGDTQQQKLYPSLRVLRLLGDTTPRFWWKRIVQSVPDSNRVTIVSGMNLYRCVSKRETESTVVRFTDFQSSTSGNWAFARSRKDAMSGSSSRMTLMIMMRRMRRRGGYLNYWKRGGWRM